MSDEVCTDPDCFLCERNRLARLRAGLAVLARNLRDAALANYAWHIGNEVGVDDGWMSCAIMRGDEPDAPDGGCTWVPNLMGAPAPGWER